MPLPTKAREGCSGLVGDAHACQLDGVDDDRRQPCCLYVDAAVGAVAKLKSCAMSLEVIGAGS